MKEIRYIDISEPRYIDISNLEINKKKEKKL